MTILEIILVSVFGFAGLTISGYSIYKMIRDFSLKNSRKAEYEIKLGMSENFFEEIQIVIEERKVLSYDIGKLIVSKGKEEELNEEFFAILEYDIEFSTNLKKSIDDVHLQIETKKLDTADRIEVIEELNRQLSNVLVAQYLINDEMKRILFPSEGEKYEV